jgi:type IV pilus assembly protein PilM
MPTPITAVDIGSYTIKIIQASRQNPLEITHVVEVANPIGKVIPDDETSAQALATVIGETFQQYQLSPKDVRLSLPESEVTTKVIEIPALTDAELASAIPFQAEQHIPIPLDDLSLEYQVLFRPDRKDKAQPMRVLMVGTRKSVVDRYVDVFVRCGIEPTMLETDMLAVIRAIEFVDTDPTTVVVHLGATRTNIAIVSQGQLQLVYTLPQAGAVLTRALEVGIPLPVEQAEEYKQLYGLDEMMSQGQVAKVLGPPVQTIVAEIQKALQFYRSEHPNDEPGHVLLTGGTAQLPKLVQSLASQLSKEVLLVAPFANVNGVIPEKNQHAFVVCLGLLKRVGS